MAIPPRLLQDPILANGIGSLRCASGCSRKCAWVGDTAQSRVAFFAVTPFGTSEGESVADLHPCRTISRLISDSVTSPDFGLFTFEFFPPNVAELDSVVLERWQFFTFSYTKYTKRKYCNPQKIRNRDFDESPRFRPP
ncbi:hypothetical protein AVEN_161506-1 [Araneus ventricosus]|uniref:Uncharacterized protein n=1 Tax=Araneus ventricosus TaxID=182803 RepID=A0A4Y2R7Y2_ARAVE|nr:hypothetical protein AVEN_161506-1 [Araneus ventricosus]